MPFTNTNYYSMLIGLLKAHFPNLLEYWDQPKELQKQLSANYSDHPKYKAIMYITKILLEE